MASARSKNSRCFSPVLQRRAVLLVIFLLTACGLCLLNYFLYDHDFAANSLLNLGEQSLLVHGGSAPRLENIGYTNQPFSLAIVLLVNNPFLATACASAVIITALLVTLYHSRQKRLLSLPLFMILFAYILLSPLSLFLFSQQMSTSIMAGLMLLVYHYLFRYCRENITFDLFMFGLLSACIFLTLFQTLFLFPLFSFALVSRVIGKAPLRSSAVLMTGLFPVMFMFFASCYMNWLFLGEPFYFFTHGNITLDVPLAMSPDVRVPFDATRTVTTTLALCRDNVLLLLPYLTIGIWMLVASAWIDSCVIRVIFLSPLFLLLIQLFFNVTEVPEVFFLLFVAASVSIYLHNHEQIRGSVFSPLFTLAMCISLLASCWQPWTHIHTEVCQFSRIIAGKSEKGGLAVYHELISALQPGEKILLDDTVNYPLVYMMKDLRRFILPYEYEFNMVLAAPQHFVRYLVVSDQPARDRVLGHYPLADAGYVPYFTLVGRFGILRLYETTRSAQGKQNSSRKQPGDS